MAKKSSRFSKLLFWKKSKSKKTEQSDTEGTPRITSDTVAEHREQVLAGARRFIYPLQQSKHRTVILSGVIIAVLLGGSVLFTGLLLYRYQSTGDFAYQVSKLIPFPVTKVNGEYVEYEDYLFELRYSLFYFKNYDQEGVNIETSEGDELVKQLKLQALEKVKLDTIAQQLAKENGIEVTDEEVQRQIEFIRNQGGIGDSDQVLEDILKSSYDWEIADLEKTIYLQLVRQSLPRVLDTETISEAEKAQDELINGANFGETAKKYSDDQLTKDNNGVIGLISRTNTDLPPEFIEAAFSLEPGETSELVESRFGLHIIKINKVDGDQREVAHVLFRYFDIDQYLRDELSKVDVVDYITIE